MKAALFIFGVVLSALPAPTYADIQHPEGKVLSPNALRPDQAKAFQTHRSGSPRNGAHTPASPEPPALLMVGTGLVACAAGMSFRRRTPVVNDETLPHGEASAEAFGYRTGSSAAILRDSHA